MATHCELIPETLPGVAYVAVDGIPDPVRVRFAWHTDDDIAQLVMPAPQRGPFLTPAIAERPLLEVIEGVRA